MSREERQALRAAIIAGPGDCVLSADEAAVFLGNIHPATLRKLDVPRADVAGTKYLKSQLLAYVRVRLSARILEPTG